MFIKAIVEWFKENHEYSKIYNELQSLSDHELRDIGICRTHIPCVARCIIEKNKDGAEDS